MTDQTKTTLDPLVEMTREQLLSEVLDAGALASSLNRECVRLLDALKACWEARTDPEKIQAIVFDAVAPLGIVTKEDIVWAKGTISREQS